jgi:hypothetical protein
MVKVVQKGMWCASEAKLLDCLHGVQVKGTTAPADICCQEPSGVGIISGVAEGDVRDVTVAVDYVERDVQLTAVERHQLVLFNDFIMLILLYQAQFEYRDLLSVGTDSDGSSFRMYG